MPLLSGSWNGSGFNPAFQTVPEQLVSTGGDISKPVCRDVRHKPRAELQFFQGAGLGARIPVITICAAAKSTVRALRPSPFHRFRSRASASFSIHHTDDMSSERSLSEGVSN